MRPPLLPFQECLADRIAAEAGRHTILPFPGSVGKEQICAAAAGRALGAGERALVVVDKVLLNLWQEALEDRGGLAVSREDDGTAVTLTSITQLRAQTTFDRYSLARSPLHREWDLVVISWRDCLHARPTQRHHATDQLTRLARQAWYVASASRVPPYRQMEIGKLGRDLLTCFPTLADLTSPPPPIARPGVILRPSGLAERLSL